MTDATYAKRIRYAGIGISYKTNNRGCAVASLSQIQAFSKEVAEQFQPERIILFGSYACGQSTEDSDVDLLLILPFEELPVRKATEVRQKIPAPFPLDLIVRTPEQIQQRLEMEDFFIQDILTNGQVLYEANHARVDFIGPE